MPSSGFFSDLGLFILEGLLDEATCRRLREEAAIAAEPAVISRKGRELVDLEVRRTRAAKVSETTLEKVRHRLLELKPELEAHFGLELSGCERPVFLHYLPGDFFAAHRDGDDEHDSADYVRKRKVSAVVFLNSQVEEADSLAGGFVGGSLVLYGLMQEHEWKAAGFPLAGREGLLIAFPSQLLHEVQPVVAGSRYTVVSWFY